MYGSNFYESDVRWEKKISWCFNSTFQRLSRCSAYVHMTQNINYLDLKKLDKLKIAIRTSFLVFHNIRSDCHYSDVINILLNAFRLKKKLQARNMELFNAIRRLYMILDFILTTLFGYSLVDGWMAEKKLCIEKNHGHLMNILIRKTENLLVPR